jgi:hypothetical protein
MKKNITREQMVQILSAACVICAPTGGDGKNDYIKYFSILAAFSR